MQFWGLMISQIEVEEILREHLSDVRITFIRRRMYVDMSLSNSFIKAQVDAGIYDLDNIYDDFLSAMRSFPALGELDVCYDLIQSYSEDVDDALTRKWLKMVAVHEAHHFAEAANPLTAGAHVVNEMACIQTTRDANPELAKLADEFEAASPVFQRVYKRIAQRAETH